MQDKLVNVIGATFYLYKNKNEAACVIYCSCASINVSKGQTT